MTESLALVQPNPAPLSSVQIEQAAKGPPRVTIKCYAVDVDEAAAHAQALYDRLVATYAVTLS